MTPRSSTSIPNDDWLGAPKPTVTDEPFDAYVSRPLAAIVVRAVVETSVTPNQLTMISGFFGTLAGACFMVSPRMALVGAAALFLSIVLDASDGQLARARGGGSPLGRILDGYADYWVALWVHVGMLLSIGQPGLTLFGHTFSPFERVLFVGAAGLSMGINAGRFDFYKQRYLAHTGIAREPEVPETFSDEAHRQSNPLLKGLLLIFAFYVRTQQGPEFRARRAHALATAADPVRVARFVQENALLLRLWSFTGPTMHNAAICATACLVPFMPSAFVGYCLFAIVAVNVYCFSLVAFQRRAIGRSD